MNLPMAASTYLQPANALPAMAPTSNSQRALRTILLQAGRGYLFARLTRFICFPQCSRRGKPCGRHTTDNSTHCNAAHSTSNLGYLHQASIKALNGPHRGAPLACHKNRTRFGMGEEPGLEGGLEGQEERHQQKKKRGLHCVAALLPAPHTHGGALLPPWSCGCRATWRREEPGFAAMLFCEHSSGHFGRQITPGPPTAVLDQNSNEQVAIPTCCEDGSPTGM